MSTAVVFAYHNVGVRCLSVLLAHDVDVLLVLTHQDDPKEHIWFDSVAALAARNHLRCATPADPNTTEWLEQLRTLQPDFIFSFYYRNMLKPELLACAKRGAFNMHGSLLPKYRGRVPVNWAVLNGERETGATLHEMVAKPDAGAIVAQQAVPILPDDTAFEVFQKVTVAAELALDKALPGIVDGSMKPQLQDLASGSYFGGRKPEDGRIQWQQSARQIHNLVRAVAPPYPGAFTDIHGKRLRVLRSRVLPLHARHPGPCLYWDSYSVRADLSDGSVLELTEVEHDGQLLTEFSWTNLFGKAPVSPTAGSVA
jgi:methionyl-tRNA formyltransferase